MSLVKTFGGETGFGAADICIQVLGGAGYTREWPLERTLRDARALTTYEGTTGIQALDVLTRRLWRDRQGLDVFLARARAGAERAPWGDALPGALSDFAQIAEGLAARAGGEAALGAADAYLRAGWDAVCAWLGQRLDPDQARPLCAYLPERTALRAAQCA